MWWLMIHQKFLNKIWSDSLMSSAITTIIGKDLSRFPVAYKQPTSCQNWLESPSNSNLWTLRTQWIKVSTSCEMISIFIILNNFSSLNTFYLNFISSQSWSIEEVDTFYFIFNLCLSYRNKRKTWEITLGTMLISILKKILQDIWSKVSKTFLHWDKSDFDWI